MKVYLIDRETNENKKVYDNVIRWGENFVEYLNGGYRGKIYCDIETEFFTDQNPEQEPLIETEIEN